MLEHGRITATPEELKTFKRLERLQKEYEPFRQLPQLRAAPHPVRLAATPMARAETLLITLAEARHQDKVLDLLRGATATVAVYDLLSGWGDRRIRNFLDSYELASDGGFGGGAAGAMLHSARYELMQGTLYSLTDDLVEMLESTDLGVDIPLEELQLPAPNVYVQLGVNRERASHHLFNPTSGMHALEGAYLSNVRRADGTRYLEITLTGSPVGKSELLDDAVEWASLEVTPGVSIAEAIEKAFMRSVRPGTPAEMASQQMAMKSHASSLMSMLELVVKAVLFLGVPEARQSSSDAGTQARKAFARAVSGAHRRKALKALAFSYDCIFVDGPAPQTDEERLQRELGNVRASHWRRGHFRHQRHGQGFSLTKVMWIRPTFVMPGVVGAD